MARARTHVDSFHLNLSYSPTEKSWTCKTQSYDLVGDYDPREYDNFSNACCTSLKGCCSLKNIVWTFCDSFLLLPTIIQVSSRFAALEPVHVTIDSFRPVMSVSANQAAQPCRNSTFVGSLPWKSQLGRCGGCCHERRGSAQSVKHVCNTQNHGAAAGRGTKAPFRMSA